MVSQLIPFAVFLHRPASVPAQKRRENPSSLLPAWDESHTLPQPGGCISRSDDSSSKQSNVLSGLPEPEHSTESYSDVKYATW